METFDLHGLILCESEDNFSELICVDNEGIGAFDLHGQLLCVPEGCYL